MPEYYCKVSGCPRAMGGEPFFGLESLQEHMGRRHWYFNCLLCEIERTKRKDSRLIPNGRFTTKGGLRVHLRQLHRQWEPYVCINCTTDSWLYENVDMPCNDWYHQAASGVIKETSLYGLYTRHIEWHDLMHRRWMVGLLSDAPVKELEEEERKRIGGMMAQELERANSLAENIRADQKSVALERAGNAMLGMVPMNFVESSFGNDAMLGTVPMDSLESSIQNDAMLGLGLMHFLEPSIENEPGRENGNLYDKYQ